MTGRTNAVALQSSQNQPVPESPTTHKVIFIDPFGVVNEQWVENGTNAIVPTPRVYDYLTFVEWNQETTNITSDRCIGATYNTTDGKTYAFITLTPITGLDLVLYLNKSDGSTLTIDWGDETTSTFTNSGNFNTGTHTYAAAGDYVITIWISSGTGTYSFGNMTNTTTFAGGSVINMMNTLTSIYIGNSVITLKTFAFYKHINLKIVSIPNSVITVLDSVFLNCSYIEIMIIPKSITSMGTGFTSICTKLIFISIPNSITIINNSFGQGVSSLQKVNIPNSIITINTQAFYSAISLLSITLPNSVKIIEYSAFDGCKSLSSIDISNYITEIKEYAFRDCASLAKINISNAMIILYNYSFAYCTSLTSMIIPNSIIEIKLGAFIGCTRIIKYVFYSTTPPTLAHINVFTGINPICKIYVPDASITAYKTATNWANYANYIYPLSDIGE